MSSIRLGIAAAALLIICSGCGSSYSSTTSPTSPTTPSSGGNNGTPVAIVAGASSMTTTAYSPSPVTIAAGGSVTWTNSDTVTHTATGGTFNSGAIAPGAKYTQTFSAAGSYTYHCTIHPGMTGTVTVQ